MIFHVDLDAFFAAIEQRDNPRLRGKPILVGRTDPQGRHCHRGVVSTCSYEARCYGISSGMPIFKALKLCPWAIIIDGHFEKYSQASNQMYKIFERYTSEIEQIGIDEAYLSFYGFEEFYHHDLVKVARNIKTDIKKEIGITASIGIAANKLVAKMASNFSKPDALTLVKKGKEKEFLASFPIGKLFGVGYAIEEKLKKLGIYTVNDLQKQKSSFIKNVLGKYGEVLLSWANGVDQREVAPLPPAKSVGRSLTLPFNTADSAFLKATLFYLCQKISNELHQECLEGKCITTIVRYSDFSTKSHQKILSSPTSSAWEIYHQATRLFDQFWTGKPLRLIGVRVSHFELQQQLEFGCLPRTNLEKIEKTIEVVRRKFGFWSIYPASLTIISRYKT